MADKNNTFQSLLGIRLMLQAAFAFSVMGVFVKLIEHRLPSMQIVFYRSLMGLVLTIFYARATSTSLKGKHHLLLILRGFSGFIALFLFFYGIANLPLGTAIILNYTAPFFAILFGYLLMKEKISLQTLGTILISFCGVFLLVCGENLHWSLASFASLGSAFFAGFAYTTIRSIKKRESHLTIIFYFTLISSILSSILSLQHFILPSPKDFFFLFCIGIIAFYAQIWLTQAYRYGSASIVAPFSYLTPLLAYFYGLIFWKEKISFAGTVGVFLIISGGILLTKTTLLSKKKVLK